MKHEKRVFKWGGGDTKLNVSYYSGLQIFAQGYSCILNLMENRYWDCPPF